MVVVAVGEPGARGWSAAHQQARTQGREGGRHKECCYRVGSHGWSRLIFDSRIHSWAECFIFDKAYLLTCPRFDFSSSIPGCRKLRAVGSARLAR
jgi:hypothetical protein